jgi:hypothetical protein
MVILAPSLTKAENARSVGRECVRMSSGSGERNKVCSMHVDGKDIFSTCFVAKKGIMTTRQSEIAHANMTIAAMHDTGTEPRENYHGGINNAAISVNGKASSEEKKASSKDSKLHKLKEKLFKH